MKAYHFEGKVVALDATLHPAGLAVSVEVTEDEIVNFVIPDREGAHWLPRTRVRVTLETIDEEPKP